MAGGCVAVTCATVVTMVPVSAVDTPVASQVTIMSLLYPSVSSQSTISTPIERVVIITHCSYHFWLYRRLKLKLNNNIYYCIHCGRQMEVSGGNNSGYCWLLTQKVIMYVDLAWDLQTINHHLSCLGTFHSHSIILKGQNSNFNTHQSGQWDHDISHPKHTSQTPRHILYWVLSKTFGSFQTFYCYMGPTMNKRRGVVFPMWTSPTNWWYGCHNTSVLYMCNMR